jgi:glycosyltransferase involved in cell wall biosynthesis
MPAIGDESSATSERLPHRSGRLILASMRIVHVNDYAAVASTLAQAQREQGHDVTVIDPTRAGFGRGLILRALLLPVRWGALLAVAVRLRRGHWDAIHIHYAWKGFVGVLAGRPFVLHCHGSDVRGIKPGSIRGRLNRLAERRAQLVYYSTPDLAVWVLPERPDAIFLPNPIDVSGFRPLEANDPARANRRDLLVGVRLDPIKGLETIVETLRLLARLRPATTVTIVSQGGGVAEAVAAAGPATQVVPRAPRSQLAGVLTAHRLSLGQFLVGAMGNYELEALAAGVPVVMRFDQAAAYASPPPLVNAATAADAARRICDLLDEPAALEELAVRGPGWVRENHDAKTLAARVLADYERLGTETSPTDRL